MLNEIKDFLNRKTESFAGYKHEMFVSFYFDTTKFLKKILGLVKIADFYMPKNKKFLGVYTLYKCAKCGTLVDLKGYTEAKCPKCRYRILFKEIPPVKRDVTAR